MATSKKIVFEYVDERSSKMPLPEYKTEGAAGFDFYCVQDKTARENDTDILIPPGSMWISTGVRAKIPAGHYVEVVPRSSSHKKSLLIFKGTIDEDYHGEIKIGVFNPTNKPIYIEEGDRIAQGILHKCVRAKLVEGDVPKQVRGGFGSTGK